MKTAIMMALAALAVGCGGSSGVAVPGWDGITATTTSMDQLTCALALVPAAIEAYEPTWSDATVRAQMRPSDIQVQMVNYWSNQGVTVVGLDDASGWIQVGADLHGLAHEVRNVIAMRLGDRADPICMQCWSGVCCGWEPQFEADYRAALSSVCHL